MYLSSLPVATGSDPNRLRPGRKWISNPYRVHQRLCMAFDGKNENRILFRSEGPIRTHRGMRPRILVQSAQEPDWDFAFGNAPFLIVGEDVEVRSFNPQFCAGQTFRFLLRANPTVKKKRAGKKNGVRLGIMSAEGQLQWLQRKAQMAGFQLIDELTLLDRGLKHSRRSKMVDPNPHVHLGVTFSGLLRVVDEAKFRAALSNGIGSGKAYGFGLLSLAPVG